MKLSVIIPAFNEAKWIQRCVRSVFAAIQANAQPGLSAEVIAVDNNSSDGTGDLARAAGASVVFEPVNQIARSRNAGAAAATGDWLLFFDADSLLPPETLADVLETMRSGTHVGGGTVVAFDTIPWWAGPLLAAGNWLFLLFRITPGCLIFCRADVFRELGGFSKDLYAAEDADLGRRMHAWAKRNGSQIVMLRKHPPITSSRKLHLYSKPEILKLLFRFARSPRATLRNPKDLPVFYDGRR
ncbi:MAG: glycosyltransferase [Verrucomicrobia bacterium]|nr:glycosyltransferase [Verrucomicrobiota bacterium]